MHPRVAAQRKFVLHADMSSSALHAKQAQSTSGKELQHMHSKGCHTRKVIIMSTLAISVFSMPHPAAFADYFTLTCTANGNTAAVSIPMVACSTRDARMARQAHASSHTSMGVQLLLVHQP